jgi:hypothetical protein
VQGACLPRRAHRFPLEMSRGRSSTRSNVWTNERKAYTLQETEGGTITLYGGPMVKNRQAYQEAYDRAVAGKSARTFLNVLMSPFEDHYTRESREQGARDGEAARTADAGEPAAAQPS